MIKILGLVIGMPANSDFGLPFENDFLNGIESKTKLSCFNRLVISF